MVWFFCGLHDQHESPGPNTRAENRSFSTFSCWSLKTSAYTRYGAGEFFPERKLEVEEGEEELLTERHYTLYSLDTRYVYTNYCAQAPPLSIWPVRVGKHSVSVRYTIYPLPSFIDGARNSFFLRERSERHCRTVDSAGTDTLGCDTLGGTQVFSGPEAIEIRFNGG